MRLALSVSENVSTINNLFGGSFNKVSLAADSSDMPPTPERADVEFPREARKTSSNPTVQGSSAWVQKVASEIGHIDMSMVPPPNVVALDPDVLKRDCQRLAHRLDRMEAWLLNPRTKWMQYWDFVILGAMFFTATITPYEVCFIWESTGLDALFFVNIVINLIFIIDTTFQFFLPYKESIRKGGGIIKNHKKIARHYLTTWFPIDFVSIIPFDYIINFAIMPAVGAESDNTSLIGATSMLRLLRLIKLVRILRASRIFARWENSISMKYSTRELISILCAVVLTLHWLSCMLGMSAQLMRSERTFDLRAAVLERVWENENLTQSSLEEPLCFGCPAPENDAMFAQPNHPAFGMDVWCESVCYTDCELDALARLQLPMAFDSQVTDRVTYLQSQESWVCRNIKRGHIRQMPAYHGEVYVAGLVVAMLQMSGGVGSIMPTNLPEYAHLPRHRPGRLRRSPPPQPRSRVSCTSEPGRRLRHPSFTGTSSSCLASRSALSCGPSSLVPSAESPPPATPSTWRSSTTWISSTTSSKTCRCPSSSATARGSSCATRATSGRSIRTTRWSSASLPRSRRTAYSPCRSRRCRSATRSLSVGSLAPPNHLRAISQLLTIEQLFDRSTDRSTAA